MNYYTKFHFVCISFIPKGLSGGAKLFFLLLKSKIPTQKRVYSFQSLYFITEFAFSQ